MDTVYLVYFLLYLFAGVCFGLAAGGMSIHNRSQTRNLDLVALGLLLWVVTEFLKSLHKL